MIATRARSLWLVAGAAMFCVACSSDSDSDSDKELPGGDWPSYGHDIKNTRYNVEETAITRDNVGDLIQVWDTLQTGVTEFGVTSTPSVVDGVVYFADWEGKLHAVNAKDGEPVWGTQLAPIKSGPNAQVNASPFVTEDRVYIGGTNNLIYSVDRATGDKNWDPAAEIGDEEQVYFWSSPNIIDDTLIIGVGSAQVFLGSEPYTFQGNLVGVDTDSGEPKWTTYVAEGPDDECFGCSIWGSAAIDEGRKLAYVGIGQSYSAPAGRLSDAVIAVDYETGDLKAGHQFNADDIFTLATAPDGNDYDVGASVVLYEIDGKDYLVAGDKGGELYALDRDDLGSIWETRLTPGGQTGGVMASPAVADGVIYVVSNDGEKGNFGGGGPAHAEAFAVDGKSGDVKWHVPVEPGVFGGIVVANGLMFFSSLDGKVHALNTDDGEELWSATMLDGAADGAAGGVTVSHGMVFVGAGWDWAPLGAPPSGGLTAFALP